MRCKLNIQIFYEEYTILWFEFDLYGLRHFDLPDDYHFFETGYCCHPSFPYAHIQLEKSTKVILSHFKEEDHPFIYDTLNNKKTPLVCLCFVYRPNKNASRTDLMNDDQKSYSFAPTYLYGSTDFHCHMISVVVYSYSNTLQSMLVDYAVTGMG